jgi:hypothetical protein
MDAIDRAFHEESAFIARCADVHALLDRMADYRHDGRAAAQKGWTKARLRAEDLIELAQARVVVLKAEAMRVKARRPEPARVNTSPPPRAELPSPPVRASVAPPARRERPVVQVAPVRSRESEATERRMKMLEAQLAEAQAAELRAKRERTQAEERERLAVAKELEREKEAAARKERAKAEARTELEGPAERTVVAVQCAPVIPAPLDEDPLYADLFARAVEPAPVAASAPAVVYTGGDLAKYRAETGLTQRLAAVRFGVAHGTIAKAEMDATKVLGAQLQAGMRNVRGR